MYDASVIAANIAKYEASAAHKLVRNEVARSREVAAHIDAKAKKAEAANAKPAWSKEELLFIRNERVLSTLDFSYWSRYALMQKDGGGACFFDSPWESQRILLSRIAAVERDMHDAVARGEPVDGILICLHKARQLGACLGKGTRVLTADLRWIPIETVPLGEKLVAFDEEAPGGKGIARKMREATVTGLYSATVPTHRLILDDGTQFVATPHHKFLCQRHGAHTCQWREVQNMKPGDKIRRVVKPWTFDGTYEDGWFGGFLDGEGSVRYKRSGGAELCGSQVPGVVLDRATRYLEGSYPFRVDVDDRVKGSSSKFGDKPVHKLTLSRMHDIFKLIGRTRPARFVDKRWWVGKELPNSGGESWATVVAVSPSLDMPVYDVQTTTGTYVAEGFASHNTAVGRMLNVHRCTTQRYRRAMAASVDDDKIQELYDRDKLIIDNLPTFLRPGLAYDEKRGHIYFDKLDSRVIYQVSSQKSGLGVGRQFDLSHLTELSTWNYPRMIELDFFPTIPQSLFTLALLESTAYMIGDWWNDFTERVRRGQSRRWRYVFIPWYAESSKYRAQPPSDWQPSAIALLHAQKIHDTSHEFMGRTIMLPRENLYWWETTRAEYKGAGSLNLFLVNYCATPEESFQHATKAAFSSELIESLRLQTRPGSPYEVIHV